jgi:hypothetical protein
MSIALASSTISSIYLGSSTVSSAYLGSTQVFGVSGSNPVTSNRLLELNNTTSSYSGSGTVWYDISGNGNNFTLVNSPTFSSIDGFLFASSSQQYAILQSGSALQNYLTGSVRGGFTLFADITPTSGSFLDPEGAIVAGWKDQGTVYKFLFELNSAGLGNTIESAVNTTPTGVTGNNSNSISRGVRTILTLDVDSSGNKNVYANNISITNAQTVPNENWDPDDPPITIASRINNLGNVFNWFNGRIKTVIIYNRTLTSLERTAVYDYIFTL